jgi:hypothetical protein
MFTTNNGVILVWGEVNDSTNAKVSELEFMYNYTSTDPDFDPIWATMIEPTETTEFDLLKLIWRNQADEYNWRWSQGRDNYEFVTFFDGDGNDMLEEANHIYDINNGPLYAQWKLIETGGGNGGTPGDPGGSNGGTDGDDGDEGDDGNGDDGTSDGDSDGDGDTPSQPPAEPIPDTVIADALDSGETLVLEEGDSTVISEDALQLIKESETVLEIDLPNGRRIRINPESITEDAVAIDLNVDVIITNQATDITIVTEEGTREVRVPANAIVIDPAAHGNFGFTLEIDISAEELADSGLRGDNVRLFYIGDDGSVTEMGRVRRNADGSITILIDSASRYVLAEVAPRIAAIISKIPVFPHMIRGVAYNAVQWAAAEEIITGRRGLFLPDDYMTREQFVLTLYRYAGEPAVDTKQVFDDVAVTRPGARAVTWAHTNGIARGEGGMFKPDDNVTREQAVLMLYRYTMLVRGNTSFNANSIRPFADTSSISSLAVDAMNWAVSNNLMTGNRNMLVPKDNITRAQAVLILHRFHTALLG